MIAASSVCSHCVIAGGGPSVMYNWERVAPSREDPPAELPFHFEGPTAGFRRRLSQFFAVVVIAAGLNVRLKGGDASVRLKGLAEVPKGDEVQVGLKLHHLQTQKKESSLTPATSPGLRTEPKRRRTVVQLFTNDRRRRKPKYAPRDDLDETGNRFDT